MIEAIYYFNEYNKNTIISYTSKIGILIHAYLDFGNHLHESLPMESLLLKKFCNVFVYIRFYGDLKLQKVTFYIIKFHIKSLIMDVFSHSHLF